jgi:hypothetical protein
MRSSKLESLSTIAAAMLIVLFAVAPAFGATVGVTVPGTANPYLAGMPNGSTCCFDDSAPAQSPAPVPIALSPGLVLTFTANGNVSNGPACTPSPECSTNGPDGGAFFVSQQTGLPGTDSSNGIARMNAPLNALVGVFLDDNRPDVSPAPGGLDFGPSGLGTSFTTLSPGLKQPFFIGDGLTGSGTGAQQQFIVPNGATRLFLGTVDGIQWNNNIGGFSATVTSGAGGAAGPLAAAVLPSSRSIQVGGTATAFATILNAGGSTATDCTISQTAVSGTFLYQTTNSSTNTLTGTPNTPAPIPPGGGQTFLIAFTPSLPFGPADVALSFACSNASAAPVIAGVNTLLLSASFAPVPDIVALAATVNNDGIVNIAGINGAGAFSVATVNVGSGALITASADTGGVPLPVSVSICQTNPSTGACLGAPAANVTVQINANATPTFAIFVNGIGQVPFNPAANRIFVRFKDTAGATRGSTSVAVRTQ